MDRQPFHQRLRTVRLTLGLTLTQAATDAAVSVGTFTAAERGNGTLRNLSRQRLEAWLSRNEADARTVLAERAEPMKAARLTASSSEWANWLFAERAALGWTQQQVADAASINRHGVTQMEKGMYTSAQTRRCIRDAINGAKKRRPSNTRSAKDA